MRNLLLLFAFLSCNCIVFGQDLPREVTPKIMQQIKADVEKQVPAFRQSISKQDLSKEEIEFSIDTFRIRQIESGMLDIDYSTAGMVNSAIETTDAYDKLMNKYYNKLLKLLKPEDKKILITAQKAWIAYRDAEAKLIGAMTREEYSGGGTIQSLIASSSYSQLVVSRTTEIYDFYIEIIKNK